MFNISTYCKIKKDAVVFQDFKKYNWENPNLIFKVVTKNKSDSSIFDLSGKYQELVAAGYGIVNNSEGVNLYGNGSLFVKKSDLIFPAKSKEYNEQYNEYVKLMKSTKKPSRIKVNIEFEDDDIKELVTLIKDTKEVANNIINKYRFDGSADSNVAEYVWSNAAKLYQSSSYLLNLFNEMRLIDKE